MSFFRRTQSLINEKQYLSCIKNVVESTAELYALYRKFDVHVLQSDLPAAALDITQAAKLLSNICESADYELDLASNKHVLLSSLLRNIKKAFPRVPNQLVSDHWIKVLNKSSSNTLDTDAIESDANSYTHLYESVCKEYLEERDAQPKHGHSFFFPITEGWCRRFHLLVDILLGISLHWINFDKDTCAEPFLVKVEGCKRLHFAEYIEILLRLDIFTNFWTLFDFIATDYCQPRYKIEKPAQDIFGGLVLERVVRGKPHNLDVLYLDVTNCNELVCKTLAKTKNINNHATRLVLTVKNIQNIKLDSYKSISQQDVDALVVKCTQHLYRNICHACYWEKTLTDSLYIVEDFCKVLRAVSLPDVGDKSTWTCAYIQTSMERLQQDILTHVEYFANLQHIIDRADSLEAADIQKDTMETTNAYRVVNFYVFVQLLRHFIAGSGVEAQHLPQDLMSDIDNMTISKYCYLLSIFIVFACTYPCVAYETMQDAGMEPVEMLIGCCDTLASQVATLYIAATPCAFQEFLSTLHENTCVQVTNKESVDPHIQVVRTFTLFISNCYYISRVLRLASIAAVDSFKFVCQKDLNRKTVNAKLRVGEFFHFTPFQSSLEIMGNQIATQFAMYNKRCIHKILITECNALLMLQEGDQKLQQQLGEYTSAWIYKMQGALKHNLPTSTYHFNMSLLIDLCYTSIPEALLDCFESINFAPTQKTVDATLSFLDKLAAILLDASGDLDDASTTKKEIYYHLFKNIFLLDNTVIEQGSMHFTQRNLNRMARLLRHLETTQT